MSSTTLTGENSFMRDAALQHIIAAFLAQYDAFGLERIDASGLEAGRVLEQLGQVSFLTTERLVILKGLSNNPALSAQITQILAAVSEPTTLVIVEPKLDKRGQLYKILKDKTEYREFPALDERQLIDWAMTYASEQPAKLGRSAARRLVEMVGNNQELLAREIEKLSLHSQQIDEAAIEQLVTASPQATTFELIDALFRGDRSRALQLYDSLRLAREEPQKILGLIVWQMHALVVAKLGAKVPQAELAKQTGVSPYTLQKSGQLVRRLTLKDIRRMVGELVDLDVRLKTTAIDPDEALRTYIALF